MQGSNPRIARETWSLTCWFIWSHIGGTEPLVPLVHRQVTLVNLASTMGVSWKPIGARLVWQPKLAGAAQKSLTRSQSVNANFRWEMWFIFNIFLPGDLCCAKTCQSGANWKLDSMMALQYAEYKMLRGQSESQRNGRSNIWFTNVFSGVWNWLPAASNEIKSQVFSVASRLNACFKS